MKDYRNLNITLEKIESIIEEFVNKANGKYEKVEHPNKLFQFRITIPGQKDALLNIYGTKKGITINPKVGSNQELSIKIADLITSKAKKVETASQSFEGVFSELFEEFKNELEYMQIEFHIEQEDANKEILKLKNKHGHELTTTYYKNRNKVLIQGKTTKIYDDIVLWFADKILENPDEIIEIIFNSMEDFKKYDIQFPDTVITNYLLEKTDGAFEILVEDEKKWMKVSFYLFHFIKDLPEYYPVIAGSLKVIEGILRRILIKKYTLMGAFQKGTKAFKPLPEYLKGYNDDTHKKVITKLYNFIKDKRHKYQHSTGIKSNLVESRKSAEEILESVVELIKEVNLYKKGLL